MTIRNLQSDLLPALTADQVLQLPVRRIRQQDQQQDLRQDRKQSLRQDRQQSQTSSLQETGLISSQVTRTSRCRFQDRHQADHMATTRETDRAYVLIRVPARNLYMCVLTTGMTLQGFILETETSCVGTVRHIGGHTTITTTDTESEYFLHMW